MIVYVSLINHFPFISQYAVVHKDGTKLNSNRRQITASGTEQSMSGKTSTFEKKFIIGDDGIGHLQHTPKPDAQFITIEVWRNCSTYYPTSLWLKADLTIKTGHNLIHTSMCYQHCYMSETWTLRKEDIMSLNAFRMNGYLKAIGIRWMDRVKNSNIRQILWLSQNGSRYS